MTTTPGSGQMKKRQGRVGVRIAGTGSSLPVGTLNNKDLEKMMETSDEWIVQRTGIRQRHISDRAKGESTAALAAASINKALAAARMEATELDLLICATMTGDMECPATASVISHLLGAPRLGGFDINGACSGFVFSLNVAHDLINNGNYRNIALVGADRLSSVMRYDTSGRGTAILFGDGAGAIILRATDDVSKGILAQSIHANGEGWKEIYIPHCEQDFPVTTPYDPTGCGIVHMNGAGVFKFAVSTFPNLIAETLEKAGVTSSDVDMFVCHQSNARILAAARERFGLSEDKLYVNIDRVGNTVAASVPLCLDELTRAGRVQPGMKVMFLAFGGGLTWGSSLWQY